LRPQRQRRSTALAALAAVRPPRCFRRQDQRTSMDGVEKDGNGLRWNWLRWLWAKKDLTRPALPERAILHFALLRSPNPCGFRPCGNCPSRVLRAIVRARSARDLRRKQDEGASPPRSTLAGVTHWQRQECSVRGTPNSASAGDRADVALRHRGWSNFRLKSFYPGRPLVGCQRLFRESFCKKKPAF
jgi:hypothetical protein